MNKTKLRITVSIMLAVLLLFIALIIKKLVHEPATPTPIPTNTPSTTTFVPNATIYSPDVATPSPTITVIPEPSPSPAQTVFEPSVGDSDAIGEITIYTERKTRTYDIMPDVDEATLKRNIGHLPGSAFPNQFGTCVLMGHRDTDFSILKYSKAGDSISIKYQDSVYTYKVKYIEIVESNDELIFEALDGDYLVLVTCYPFRYTGNAPQKFIAVCERYNS